MHLLRKQFRKMVNKELAEVTEAIQTELTLRLQMRDAIAESVERRTAQRMASYHQAKRSALTPARASDSRESRTRRAA